MSMTNEERQTLVRRELEKAHVIGTCHIRSPRWESITEDRIESNLSRTKKFRQKR